MLREEKMAKPMIVHTNLEAMYRVEICAEDLAFCSFRMIWRMGLAVVLARVGVILTR